jgi:uncharacterized protein YecE (DUF72 family)
MEPRIRVGISGWTYRPWRGVFYPAGLPQREELAWASRRLASIEINGTFYRLQRPETFRAWYDATPPDFCFAVKGGRYLTHMLHLQDARAPLANFLASGVLALGEKLGPILWQLPPTLRYEPDQIEAFLALLPRDHRAAARLAEGCDDWVMERAWLAVSGDRPMRHALEVRNRSFLDPRLLDALRRFGVALVFADTAGKWPYAEDVTADFVYARLHGDQELYASGYTPAALDRWAARFAAWHAGKEPADAHRVGPPDRVRTARDVYVYFDNDVKVHAPFDAMELARRLEVVSAG